MEIIASAPGLIVCARATRLARCAGHLFRAIRTADRAIPLFRKALKLKPELPKSLAGLGRAYLAKSQPEEALRYMKQAVRMEPNDAPLHYQLGQAYLLAEALATCERRFTEGLVLAVEEKRRLLERMRSYGPKEMVWSPVGTGWGRPLQPKQLANH